MADILIRTADDEEEVPEEDMLAPLGFQVEETVDAIELTAVVGAFEEADIEVVLDGDRLIVTGYHEEDEEEAEDDEAEAFVGFSQSFPLPAGVTTAQVDADLEDGVLTIVIEKPVVPERGRPVEAR